MFGTVAEEKDVTGITSKLHEAKSSKTYETLEILAKYISSGCISKIITPLKEVCFIVFLFCFCIVELKMNFKNVVVGIHKC